MNIPEQRSLGITMAEKANAPKTLQMLHSGSGCYKAIFEQAAAEVGMDALMQYLLQGDPIWAFQALDKLNDIGNYKEALVNKNLESPDAAVHTLRFVKNLGSQADALETAAGAQAAPLGIAEFELHAEDAVYAAYYTMHWIHGGVAYSNEMYVEKWIKDYCDKWTNGQPMAVGDLMSISVHAAGGQTVASPLLFSWLGEPIEGNCTVAKFGASGTVDSVHLDYGGSWNPCQGI